MQPTGSKEQHQSNFYVCLYVIRKPALFIIQMMEMKIEYALFNQVIYDLQKISDKLGSDESLYFIFFLEINKDFSLCYKTFS